MPNLVITNACNLRCPFCFASEYRCGEQSRAARMTLDELGAQIEFAGVDTARFCGGEPTLHPEFTAMLDLALAPARRRVFIMTNGLWPAPVREHLAGQGPQRGARITYLLNVLEPDLYTEPQRQSLWATLAALEPHRVTLGFTLYKTVFDHTGVRALAERFGIRNLRYSIAAPTVTDPRSWNVDPERDFPSLAEVVFRLEIQARAEGIELQSDCGYIPPCMFDPEALAGLLRHEPEASADRFHCQGPIDIGPGGEAWRCYGLYSTLRARTGDFRHGGELAAHFEERLQTLAGRLLFDACADCDWQRRGVCGGGCHAFRAVRALRARADAGDIAIADDARLREAVVVVDEQRLHFFMGAGGTRVMLQEADGTWAEVGTTPAEIEVLRACDGTRTVGAIVERVRHSAEAAAIVARTIRRFYELGALGLKPGTG